MKVLETCLLPRTRSRHRTLCQASDFGRFWTILMNFWQSRRIWTLRRAKDEFVDEIGSKMFQNHLKTVKNS